MHRVKKQGKNNYAIYSKCKDNQLENQIILEMNLERQLNIMSLLFIINQKSIFKMGRLLVLRPW